ncbi:MAG: patatin-like phospholipase family protein [Gemmatimonadota bacterium]|nr:patatin-like phospholipase family protein [Gemmatimonadota bacterium]
MSSRRLSRTLVLPALLALGAGTARAQHADATPVTGIPHPIVGLVLSGGSAKGFAHIGVLQVLHELGIHVDLVTGTSMGAIVGGLYATGYTADQLDSIVTREDWGNLFRRPTDRRQQSPAEKAASEKYMITFPLEHARIALPEGVVPRQAIAERLERLMWPVRADTNFNKLPTAFGALVTDLGTGTPILLQHGSLAEAVEASAAVPGAFAPVRLPDGRRVVDGAVVRNIPAEDARNMGADLLICVDVSERPSPPDSLRTLIDVVDQTVSFRVHATNKVERAMCNVVIDPDVMGVPSLDFGQAQLWIDRGRAAALAVKPALMAIADSQHAARGAIPPRPPIPPDGPIYLRQVSWTSVSPGADALVRATVGLDDDTWVTQKDIAAAVSRIYSTGRFDQVSFRVQPRREGDDLLFDLTEGDRDVVGVGIRYDTPRGASLLVGATVNDWLTPGSKATLTARLGDEEEFDGRFMLGAGPEARFLQTYRATFIRTSLPHVRPVGVASAPVIDVHELSAQIARVLGNAGYFGVQLTHARANDGVAGADSALAFRTRSYTTVGGVLSLDTYNRVFAPTTGISALMLWEHDVGSGASFEHQFADLQGAYPVMRHASLVGRADIGYGSGPDLPLHDRFFLGGSVPSTVWAAQFVPFLGLDPQSAQGTVVHMLQGGVQAEVRDNLYVTLRGNVGNVFDKWPAPAGKSAYLRGAGLTIGTTLAPGPVSITFGTRSVRQTPVIEVNFGATF